MTKQHYKSSYQSKIVTLQDVPLVSHSKPHRAPPFHVPSACCGLQTKAKFAESDAKLVPMLEALDKEVADMTTGPFRGFVEAVKKLNEHTGAVYGESLEATESPAPPAPAAEEPAK